MYRACWSSGHNVNKATAPMVWWHWHNVLRDNTPILKFRVHMLVVSEHYQEFWVRKCWYTCIDAVVLTNMATIWIYTNVRVCTGETVWSRKTKSEWYMGCIEAFVNVQFSVASYPYFYSYCCHLCSCWEKIHQACIKKENYLFIWMIVMHEHMTSNDAEQFLEEFCLVIQMGCIWYQGAFFTKMTKNPYF